MAHIIPETQYDDEEITEVFENDDSDDDLFPEEEIEEGDIPDEVMELIDAANENLQPNDSKKIYNQVYKKFINWKDETGIKCEIRENILLGYFEFLSRKNLAPGTLWSIYSMLKNTINIYNDIDIKGYSKLKTWIKNKNKGYTKNKSKVFSPEQVRQFVTTADDQKWLATKVALIFGMYGACRRGELHLMVIKDVKDEGNCLMIDIPKENTKNNVAREFAVKGPFYQVVKKYMDLRPSNCPTNNFFIGYRNGTCIRGNMGIHNLGGMPKRIATFLQLPDPHRYTGHTFRRSSATCFVNAGASMVDLKRLGGWSSDKCAMGYVEESTSRKRQVGEDISNAIFSSNNSSTLLPPKKKIKNINEKSSVPSTSKKIYEEDQENQENQSSIQKITATKTATTPSIITTPGGTSLRFENCYNIKIFINDSQSLKEKGNTSE